MTAPQQQAAAAVVGNDALQSNWKLAGRRMLLTLEKEAVPFDRRMWNIAAAPRGFGADVTVRRR